MLQNLIAYLNFRFFYNLVCGLALLAIVPVAVAGPATENECNALKKDASVASNVIVCTKGYKLHLYSDMGVLQGNYIQLTQGSLEEVSYDGKVVRKIELKGKNSWSQVVEEEDGTFSTTYSATDSVKPNSDLLPPAIFNMTVSFGTRTTSFSEPGPCSSCTDKNNGTPTFGNWQNPDNGRCKQSDSSTGPFKRQCTSTVTVEKDVLQYNFKVANWDFQDSANKLRYRVNLKTKKDKDFFPLSESIEVNLVGTGLIELSNEGVITKTVNNSDEAVSNESVSVDVTIDNKEDNKLDFEFGVGAYPNGYHFDY